MIQYDAILNEVSDIHLLLESFEDNELLLATVKLVEHISGKILER